MIEFDSSNKSAMRRLTAAGGIVNLPNKVQ